ncbi:helix-turn-helix domain-containing protein [Leeia oryzae]|uniref:helix-turn-helix domain-containing protein n=1 Tax=Leeia oryzae TaxID=356662 RepID=UPI0003A1B05D|nr:helix-turn-helix domain-containing protein [Leeia oryzae]
MNRNTEDQAQQFVDWQLQYTQISAGKFRGCSSIIKREGISIHIEDLNKRILQRGHVPSSTVAVGIPLSLEGHAQICGEQSSRDTLHVFSCYPEFEFASPECHLVANVELATEQLSTPANQALAQELRSRLNAPAILLTPDAAENVRGLISTVSKLQDLDTVADEGVRQSQQAQLERWLMYGLLESVSAHTEAHREVPKLKKSWQVVRQVESLLENPATCVKSIAELCVALQLSRRTIQYAFEYALGMNPVSYLRAVRLNHIRTLLIRGESVTFAATQWGFLHLSAFAQDYCHLFGELPSATHKRYRA